MGKWTNTQVHKPVGSPKLSTFEAQCQDSFETQAGLLGVAKKAVDTMAPKLDEREGHGLKSP